MPKLTRSEILFKECQETVISSTLAAFGLNMGMFTDRDGGNVTTLHNFERETDQFIHDRDKASFKSANSNYERSNYELNGNEWRKKKEQHAKAGQDDYTGKPFKDQSKVELDHVVPLKQIHDDKKNHLAMNTGTEKGRKNLKNLANDDTNLAVTDKSINASKGAKTNTEFLNTTDPDKLKDWNVDPELMGNKEKQATHKINSEVSITLLKKQTSELIISGSQQALNMGVKQALGILLTKVVNIVFREVKFYTREGVEFTSQTLSDIKTRLLSEMKGLLKEIPEILSSALKGGISGFVSNLLTFLLNSVFSTVKKLVTMIREGLVGIYKAIKIIFFPPQGMSTEDVWRSAIKLLSTTVISAFVVTFAEGINAFLAGFPFLLPFAEILSGAIVGILSGVLSALTAYTIDVIFDKLFANARHNKLMLELQLKNSEFVVANSSYLIESTENFLKLGDLYNQAIKSSKQTLDNLIRSVQNNELAIEGYSVICDNNIKHSNSNQIIRNQYSQLTENTEIILSSNYDLLEEFCAIETQNHTTILLRQKTLEKAVKLGNEIACLLEKQTSSIELIDKSYVDIENFIKSREKK